MAKKEPGSFRLVATLAIAGLLSGAILVAVFLSTQPRIERNRAEALARAIFKVLPGTDTTATFVLRDGGLAPYDGPEGTLPQEEAVYAGYGSEGGLVGYAIPAEGPGYMDTIQLLYGLDPARRVVVGVEVLDSRETPGLGDKILDDPEFHANFEALAVEPEIVPVKKGERANPNEVDCITGATISSESIVAILNRSSVRWLPLLSGQEQARLATERGDGGSEH